jgi:hypothetical protein
VGGAALAGSLSGTVVDESGAPVEGALVQAYDILLRAEETETDADGAWRLDDLPAGTWRVRAVPTWSDSHVARWHPSTQGFCESAPLVVDTLGDEQGVQITVVPGARIRGRLLDATGAPIANEVIWALAADEPTDALLDRPTLTGPTGEFVVRGLDAPEAGAGLWTLYTRPEGFPDQYLGGVYRGDEATPVDLPAEDERDVGDWTLNDGILVSGRAVGPAGPIAGGTVHVYAGGQVVTVETDEDGRYEAVGLPPGDVLPWVSAEGHAMTYYPDHDRATEYAGTVEEDGGVIEVGDLVAPLESRLRVSLADPEDGRPLGGMSALLYNDDQTVGRGDLVDDAGRLTIDRLHPGDYRLYVWGESAGYADDWVRGDDGEPATLTLEGTGDGPEFALTLPRGGIVSGQVRGESGAPLAGATVVLRRVEDGALAATTTDREGRYLLGGLAAGAWTAQAGFEPLCPGDPSAVSVYLGPTVNPAWQGELELDPGGRAEGVDFWLPEDADRDRMGDAWERAAGLDPERDDSAEDPDGDTYDNLTEYHLGTDPLSAADAGAGCGGCGGGGAAALALLPLAAVRRRRRP